MTILAKGWPEEGSPQAVALRQDPGQQRSLLLDLAQLLLVSGSCALTPRHLQAAEQLCMLDLILQILDLGLICLRIQSSFGRVCYVASREYHWYRMYPRTSHLIYQLTQATSSWRMQLAGRYWSSCLAS